MGRKACQLRPALTILPGGECRRRSIEDGLAAPPSSRSAAGRKPPLRAHAPGRSDQLGSAAVARLRVHLPLRNLPASIGSPSASIIRSWAREQKHIACCRSMRNCEGYRIATSSVLRSPRIGTTTRFGGARRRRVPDRDSIVQICSSNAAAMSWRSIAEVLELKPPKRGSGEFSSRHRVRRRAYVESPFLTLCAALGRPGELREDALFADPTIAVESLALLRGILAACPPDVPELEQHPVAQGDDRARRSRRLSRRHGDATYAEADMRRLSRFADLPAMRPGGELKGFYDWRCGGVGGVGSIGRC